MNNISILRNPDSLEILGFAPIYDSGNSMFYNIPYEQLKYIHINDIKTHSFIEKEVKLLSYVHNRKVLDLDKAEMEFDIFERDTLERHIRNPLLQELYEKKLMKLKTFQNGRDIWKSV